MPADYIKVFFENICRQEIIQIVSQLKYSIDDIKSTHYFASEEAGNEQLCLPEVINLINNQYNV